MTHIGFTGSSQGMTMPQQIALRELLVTRLMLADFNLILHHGDCIGADAECVAIAHGLEIETIAHPANRGADKRAFTKGNKLVLPEKSPLDRNLDIVREGVLLIAAPKQAIEVRRSGTWATVRYARRFKVETLIVLPTGITQQQRIYPTTNGGLHA